MVLFGGDDGAIKTLDNDTYPASSPPARYDAAMTYDPDHRRVIVFGGSAGSALLNDTWTWDGTHRRAQ